MHTLAPRERLPKGIRLIIVARAVNRLGAFSLSRLGERRTADRPECGVSFRPWSTAAVRQQKKNGPKVKKYFDMVAGRAHIFL